MQAHIRFSPQMSKVGETAILKDALTAFFCCGALGCFDAHFIFASHIVCVDRSNCSGCNICNDPAQSHVPFSFSVSVLANWAIHYATLEH